MSSSLFQFGRKHKPQQELLNSHVHHETPPFIQLRGARDSIHSMIFVQQQSAIICASDDRLIRVYDRNTDGKPKAVFDNHRGWVQGLAQLHDDLVVSVSVKDMLLLTWRVSDTHQIAKWVHTEALSTVAKLDNSHIVVGDRKGGMFVLHHTSGASLQLKEELYKHHSQWINCIIVRCNLFVTCSDDKTAIVWDAKSYQPLAMLHHNAEVYSAAINDNYIVTSTRDIKLHVFENAPDYNPIQILQLPQRAYAIQFLDKDIVALACGGGSINFISLSQNSFLSRCKLPVYLLWSLVVLPNAEIAACGVNGFSCIFSPPEPALSAVQACAARLYPSSQTEVPHFFPLQAAWDGVQEGSLSLYNACATIITSDNCKRSLDEWCIAHNLLMRAVNSGVIPPSRHFNGIQFHWHQVLYHHCSKLAIGEKDIAYLLSLFGQAEDAGVIAKGGAEVLIEIISIRKDIVQDTRLITNAIYKLFLRQAHMDARLKQVLHYQKVQQLTSLINAIVGCIPLAGGIATNVLSGGASILNDFQVSGLVESLIGVGKDFSAFGSDHLVDRFFSRSTQILSPEEWQKLSGEQRKVVKDAALNLGLTVDELRNKLGQVETEDQSFSESPGAKVIIEEIEPCDSVGNSRISTQLPVESNEISVPETQAGVVTAFPFGEGSQEDMISQLRSLEHAGVEKNRIRALNSSEIATTLSAFLVMYKVSNTKKYGEIRNVLVEKFDAKSIKGRTFVQSSDSLKKSITKVVLNAIYTVVDEDDIEFLLVLLDEFLDSLC